MEKQTALLQNRKTARLLYWFCFVCLMLAAGVLLFGRLSAALRVKGGPVQLHGKLFPGRGADKHRGGKSLNIWVCFV